MALLLLHTPLERDYSEFFQKCFSQIPSSCVSAHILVGSQPKLVADFTRVLLLLYLQARECATSHGFGPTFDIEVLFRATGAAYRQTFCLKSESSPTPGIVQVDLDLPLLPKQNTPHETKSDVVAVGGTFDHIHDGHKILLQTTAFCARSHVIVGVTGAALLKKKKYAEMLQLLSDRIDAVVKILQRHLPPHVLFSIYEINDVCGPTGYVRDINSLVISQETAAGAKFVNNYRKERGFGALEVVLVEVVGGDGSGSAENNWKGKLSSTDFRELEWKEKHGQASPTPIQH